MIELITVLLGLPTLLYGAMEGGSKLHSRWNDFRYRKQMGSPPFIVLRTYVKYIMWEDYCEMIKLRQIRTFRKVQQLKLDRYPRAGILGKEEEHRVRDFYSLPGTASQKADFFVVNLEPAEELQGGKEYPLVFGYIVPSPLCEIHPDEEEEGVTLQAPFGRDEVSLEVHLPRTRRFGPKSKITVRAVYIDQPDMIIEESHYKLSIDRAFKNTDVSRETDVLRFRMRPPQNAQKLQIRWTWSRHEEDAPTTLPNRHVMA